MKKQTHAHKLKKHTYKKTGNSVYFCVLPNCSYKAEVAFCLGKTSICWICEREFTITELALRLLRPHCSDCGRVKVIDAQGKPRYVRKVTSKILPNIAVDTVADLRSRLDNAVRVELEDDI